MHVLLIYCHPRNDSFCAALRDAAVAGLRAADHTVEVRDLYADGFVPALDADERGRYYHPPANLSSIEAHVQRFSMRLSRVLDYDPYPGG